MIYWQVIRLIASASLCIAVWQSTNWKVGIFAIFTCFRFEIEQYAKELEGHHHERKPEGRHP